MALFTKRDRIAIAIISALILIGCAPSRAWAPDGMYTETSTYDSGQTLYQEVGVTGALSENIRMGNDEISDEASLPTQDQE